MSAASIVAATAFDPATHFRVDEDFMVTLRVHVRQTQGGYGHTFEVQTWNGLTDRGLLPDADNLEDEDIDHFDLQVGTILPRDAAEIDVVPWAYKHKESRCIDRKRFANFGIEIYCGQIVRAWEN